MNEQAVTDSQPEGLTSKYARLNENDRLLVITLHEAGKPQTEIASIVGCSQSTVSTVLRQANTTPEAVRKVMRSYMPTFIKGVVDAVEPAAKRGDSTPALKAMQLAHAELGPQPLNGAGQVGVQIVIGQPGAPIELPSITVTTQAKADLRPSLSPLALGESVTVND